MSATSAAPSRKSAVDSVAKSGFDLVPARKRRGKPATMRDLAKIDWKPWEPEPSLKGKLFPTDKFVSDNTVTARVAYGLMLKTRDELIAAHRKLEHETVDQLMGKLAKATEFFKFLAHTTDSAYVRVLAAACANQVKGGKFLNRGKLRRMPS